MLELRELCEKIGLDEKAKAKVCETEIPKTEYEECKQLYKENAEAFYHMILQKENAKEKFLVYYCRFACDTYQKYKENRLEDALFYETFKDITIWCNHCFKEHGIYGIAVYDWFWRFFELKLFRFGRLEYEIMDAEYDVKLRKFIKRSEESCIAIHIPQDGALKWEECEKSLHTAYTWFGTEIDYICHSWLLFPGLREVLPENSNIIKFQKHFQILKVDYNEREAEWRIFGPVLRVIRDYPEETSLQRTAKAYLLEGKSLGVGLGKLI
ncbi:MAG: acyltransferase domain-containing protein [Suilimivivens sp.]